MSDNNEEEQRRALLVQLKSVELELMLARQECEALKKKMALVIFGFCLFIALLLSDPNNYPNDAGF